MARRENNKQGIQRAWNFL